MATHVFGRGRPGLGAVYDRYGNVIGYSGVDEFTDQSMYNAYGTVIEGTSDYYQNNPYIAGHSWNYRDFGAQNAAPTRQAGPDFPKATAARGATKMLVPGEPKMDVLMRQPTVARELGSISTLTELDNALSTVSGTLAANTANTLSTVWEYNVPTNKKLHFKPQNEIFDANITSFVLDIKDSTPEYIQGYYQIIVYNANQTYVHGVLASGALRKFGIGTTSEASITDIQKRVYYTLNILVDEGCIIRLNIFSSSTLSTSDSSITLEFVEYVP